MRFWLAAFFGITITSLLHAQGVELKSACLMTLRPDNMVVKSMSCQQQ
jgi:hypothetical protein